MIHSKTTPSVEFTPFAPSPIAIGGLGGSGTRVFAALLRAAGVHIGDCLNAALDNLWFTVLFKRAAWGRPDVAQAPDPADIARSIDLFHRAMTVGLADSLTQAEQDLLEGLRRDLIPIGDWQCGARSVHADNLVASSVPENGDTLLWGWKEPNTHVFLPHLDQQIPGLRYIHIVRNGLDMAFSKNTWQVRHWAHLYQVPEDPDVPLPVRQLRYWIAANTAAISYGMSHMAGRFMVVEYEDFCARPAQHWIRIQKFLGLPADRPLPEGLVEPSTIGRSADHDLSDFTQDTLTRAHALQSEVGKLGRPVCDQT